MPNNVKCADCGYLAIRHRETRQLLDAEDGLRTNGYLLMESQPGHLAYEHTLVCFVHKFNLRKELGHSPNEDAMRKVVQEDRICDGFTPWKQGFTPKEHREMIQEEARLKRQAEREAADRRWRLFELIVMGVIVTIVSALVQLAAAFIERGSWFPDRQAVVSTLPTPAEASEDHTANAK